MIIDENLAHRDRSILSASVVALALVAQATDFGRGFRIFALLVLPVVLFLGWATYERVAMSSTEITFRRDNKPRFPDPGLSDS